MKYTPIEKAKNIYWTMYNSFDGDVRPKKETIKLLAFKCALELQSLANEGSLFGSTKRNYYWESVKDEIKQI